MVARPPSALTAATWDALARRHLVDGARGSIHSVFDRALNLRVDDGELIGLVGPDAGNGPATVVLAASPSDSFTSSGLAPGQPWSISGHRLTLGSHVRSVNLATARPWRPTRPVFRCADLSQPRAIGMPREIRLAGRQAGDDGGAADALAAAIPQTVAPDELLLRLRRAEHVAGAAAPAGGLAALLPHVESLVASGPTRPESIVDPPGQAPRPASERSGARTSVQASTDPVVRRAAVACAELLRGWLAGDPERVTAAALRLSGLGPGLTPSGDDLLAGFLVGVAWCSGRSEPILADAIVAATRGRTTDIAAARVRHAAGGLIEERMDDVIAALLIGERTDLEPVVRRAAAWGHTSGADTLVGLFLGLRVGLLNRPARPRPCPGTVGEEADSGDGQPGPGPDSSSYASRRQ